MNKLLEVAVKNACRQVCSSVQRLVRRADEIETSLQMAAARLRLRQERR